jgi:hypothetical protein
MPTLILDDDRIILDANVSIGGQCIHWNCEYCRGWRNCAEHPLNGTYTMAADGRGTLNVTGGGTFVIWMVSPNKAYINSVDASSTLNAVIVIEK